MVVRETDYDFLKSTFDDSYSDMRPKGLKGVFHSVAAFCQQGLTKAKNAKHTAPVETDVRREDFFFDRDEYVPEYQEEDDLSAPVTGKEAHQKSLRGKFLPLTAFCHQGSSKTSKDNNDILPPPPPSDRWDDAVTRTLPGGTQIRIAHAFKTAHGRVATNDVFVLPRDPDYMIHYIRGRI
jgi:hypothetical protein